MQAPSLHLLQMIALTSKNVVRGQKRMQHQQRQPTAHAKIVPMESPFRTTAVTARTSAHAVQGQASELIQMDTPPQLQTRHAKLATLVMMKVGTMRTT